MKALTKVADRLVSRLVPPATAHARPCEQPRQPCWNGSRYQCWYDECQGFYLDCYRIGSC
ncbi:hypothetical protein Afil01_06920 [Actinorhabdospora filicis]|uniref:Uncharacterized protein n=1 Tax=Actinorhabdospora filicis TaxID=1785913 RepID=A0A9W6SH47_9ACTN|nr:hypothetical protein [Actinorhabdospora filicis]GLZ75885.1 hypothetical protein Afil01_06920 [Actinorhabdospora filicis]